MKIQKKRASNATVNLWSWLFPVTYLIHIAEEYWGGEGYMAYLLRIRGVHLSTTRFLVAQSVGVFLVILAVILARQFHFRQMMLLILGTMVLGNGITHTATSLIALSYGPGLISSILIWIPLGTVTVIRFRNEVRKKQFWVAIATGVGINVLIAIIIER